MEQLRQSEEAQRTLEAARHRLEVELRDMAARLEQTEHTTLREGKRIVAKLQNRVSIFTHNIITLCFTSQADSVAF